MSAKEHHCKACGDEFSPSREWQVFCSHDCKKQLEKIYSDFFSAIRPYMIDCVDNLYELRNRGCSSLSRKTHNINEVKK